MEISTKLKERFCKDCNIPIKIYQEPYFTDRLMLYDKFYDSLHKWDIFVNELESKYKCEQDYFEEYNRVKDAAIDDIKSTEAYQNFNHEDDNLYRPNPRKLPSKDIFHPSNDGRKFISIDMRKANFSVLKYYDSGMFFGAKTWEEFIGRYTDNKHIINSKYIRQVILGNCNPKRHISYEKYLIDNVLKIMYGVVAENRIVFFSNDEIVYDVTTLDDHVVELVAKSVDERLKRHFSIPFRVELFTLHKIDGTSGYYKKFKDGSGEFKCLDNYMLPFVMRKINDEEVTENDKVFYHEGLLAKFIEVPEIKSI